MALSSLSSVKTDSCLPSGKCTGELIKIAKSWQIPPSNFTENPLEMYSLILLQVFLFFKSRHLGAMANTDSNTDRGRCFLSYQCYFTHTSPSVLQQFLNPLNMTNAINFIYYLHSSNAFSLYTHTHRAKCQYSMRCNGLFHGKTSEAQRILQWLMSATQKLMSSLKRYLCKMSPSGVTGKGSPLQVADNRCWI